MDILKIESNILIRVFHITFSYITKRNNKKHRTIEIKSTGREDAEFWFHKWVEKFNSENEFKAYSNVKILECEEVNRYIETI